MDKQRLRIPTSAGVALVSALPSPVIRQQKTPFPKAFQLRKRRQFRLFPVCEYFARVEHSDRFELNSRNAQVEQWRRRG